jgi:putative ABC transport system substrate-binding protein
MGSAIDPIGSGFVASLARPQGNITGLSNLTGDLGPKHLEMLRSIVPKLSQVVVLVNPANPGHSRFLGTVQTAAQNSALTILPSQARSLQELENAFPAIARQNAKAVIVATDPLFNDQRRRIAELALKYRLATISSFREYADAGCLMSYGTNVADNYRRAATYVDKIFKGAKPGDIPVEQPTKLELIINGKTAKELGLKIPQSLLVMADKVIE